MGLRSHGPVSASWGMGVVARNSKEEGRRCLVPECLVGEQGSWFVRGVWKEG